MVDALGPPGALVLEVGCGPGQDAAFLAGSGFRVVAFDRSLPALRRASEVAPAARLLRADASRPLPFRDGAFAAAIASLSLHYLPWTATLAAVAEIRRVLVPGAAFAFRVNATDDIHHGAGEGEEVEPGLFRARPPAHADLKRFFDEPMARALVTPAFDLLSLRHVTIHRYEYPKQAWEGFVRAR
jgi:SAM-dependent methyltransferase